MLLKIVLFIWILLIGVRFGFLNIYEMIVVWK